MKEKLGRKSVKFSGNVNKICKILSEEGKGKREKLRLCFPEKEKFIRVYSFIIRGTLVML